MLDSSELCKKYSRVITEKVYVETVDAWDHLIEDFIEEMNDAAKAFKKGSIHISHIKEKFGGLRIYVDYHLPDEQITDLEQIVSKYEHLSLKTCTVCSSEEKQMHKRKGYWDIVICEECYNERHINGK